MSTKLWVAEDVSFFTGHAEHEWTEEDGLPHGTVAWAEPDHDSTWSPHQDFTHTKFVSEGHDWIYEDDVTVKRVIEEYRSTYTYDEDRIRTEILEAIDPLAIERFDFGDYGRGTMWAFIPRMGATQLLGDPKYWDAAEWLQTAEDLPAYAAQMLAGDIATFKLWDENGSWIVRAGNLITGEESPGLHGVLDDHPWNYLKEVALEEAQSLAEEGR